MGTRNLDKAQRGRDRAILRQLLPEIGYVNSGIRKAGVLILLGEASEVVKDYSSARDYYSEALYVLVDIQTATDRNHYLWEKGTLADLVQEGTEIAQDGLRNIEAKIRLSAYVPV